MMYQPQRRPRIAIIIPGGIGTGHNNIGVPVLERMVKMLSDRFELTVFQLYKINPDYRAHGFELVEVHSRFAMVRLLKAIFLFWKAHGRHKFQAVHGFWILPSGFLAVLLGKVFNIKSIVSVLGGDAIGIPEINYGQLLRPVYRWFSMVTLRNAGEVMALTQYLVDNLVNAGMVHRPIRVVPWGIDTSLFVFRPNLRQSPTRFLHIANLHPVKDQVTLLHAFKIISDTIPSHLTLIGEGTAEGNIKGLADKLHLRDRITFLGLKHYEALVEQYHRADILLHTSLSEGQSEVVTEAMSCGVLVCGTKVGLLYDLPECCVSVEVKDYQGLAAETLAILQDDAQRAAIIMRAHAWNQIHSLAWTVDRTSELYE